MPRLKYRPIRPEDLDGVTAVARLALPYDPVSRPLVEEKIFGDPCFHPGASLVCAEGDRVIAFAPVALCDHPRREPGKTAFVKLFGTHPDCRDRGIMAALFSRLERKAAAEGAARVRIMDHGRNYLAPGIDTRYTAALCFLRKHGYERVGEALNMKADLLRVAFDLNGRMRQLSRGKISVRRAKPDDVLRIRSLLERFWAAWIPEVLNTFNNEPVSTFIALSGRKVAAFSSYEGNNRGTPWFGPMGTDPEYRGRRIGELLCLLCLRDLKEKGHRNAVIPWVGPVHFYARVCGAEIDRIFWQYAKKLEAC